MARAWSDGSRLRCPTVARTSAFRIGRLGAQRARPREHQQVLDDAVECVQPRDDLSDDRLVARVGRHPGADHLERSPDAGDRVLHLVRDNRRHLPEPRERFLLLQPLLRSLPLGDLVADRHVLIGLAAFVEERNDRRIHPVDRAVLGAIPNLAAPDASVGDRDPQVPDELFRVICRIDDPVIVAEQLLARVLRDVAELLVGVGDSARRVGDGHDRGLIDRRVDVGEGFCLRLKVEPGPAESLEHHRGRPDDQKRDHARADDEGSPPLAGAIHPPRTASTDTTDAATNWKRGGPSSVPTSSGRTYSMPTPAARGAAEIDGEDDSGQRGRRNRGPIEKPGCRQRRRRGRAAHWSVF